MGFHDWIAVIAVIMLFIGIAMWFGYRSYDKGFDRGYTKGYFAATKRLGGNIKIRDLRDNTAIDLTEEDIERIR